MDTLETQPFDLERLRLFVSSVRICIMVLLDWESFIAGSTVMRIKFIILKDCYTEHDNSYFYDI